MSHRLLLTTAMAALFVTAAIGTAHARSALQLNEINPNAVVGGAAADDDKDKAGMQDLHHDAGKVGMQDLHRDAGKAGMQDLHHDAGKVGMQDLHRDAGKAGASDYLRGQGNAGASDYLHGTGAKAIGPKPEDPLARPGLAKPMVNDGNGLGSKATLGIGNVKPEVPESMKEKKAACEAQCSAKKSSPYGSNINFEPPSPCSKLLYSEEGCPPEAKQAYDAKQAKIKTCVAECIKQ